MKKKYNCFVGFRLSDCSYCSVHATARSSGQAHKYMHLYSSSACSGHIPLMLLTTWIDDWNPGLAESDRSLLFRLTIGQHFTQHTDAREEADGLQCQALVWWHAAGGAPRAAGHQSRGEVLRGDKARPSRAKPSQRPTVCQCGRACVCQTRPDLWPKRELAGRERVQVRRCHRRRLGRGGGGSTEHRRAAEGGGERLRWAAGNECVCRRASLRRLLTRRGKGKGPQCRAVSRGANVWREPIASICLPLRVSMGAGGQGRTARGKLTTINTRPQ